MSGFIKTVDILSAMKAALIALQLPAQYSALPDYPKAFTTVEVYRQENLLKALEDLLVFDDRVCLVVPGADTYQDHSEGRVIVAARSSEFHLLIADRDYGKAQAELIGGAEAPGVLALKDLVVANLFGSNLNLSGVALAPTSGDPLHLTDREREDAPGRDCWAQSFTTTAGRMKASIIR